MAKRTAGYRAMRATRIAFGLTVALLVIPAAGCARNPGLYYGGAVLSGLAALTFGVMWACAPRES